jgi:hypothetical protein
VRAVPAGGRCALSISLHGPHRTSEGDLGSSARAKFHCDSSRSVRAIHLMQRQIQLPLGVARRGLDAAESNGWIGRQGEISAAGPAGNARYIGEAPTGRMGEAPLSGGAGARAS